MVFLECAGVIVYAYSCILELMASLWCTGLLHHLLHPHGNEFLGVTNKTKAFGG